MLKLLFVGPVRLSVVTLITIITLMIIRPRLVITAGLGLLLVGAVITQPRLRSGAFSIIESLSDAAVPKRALDAELIRTDDAERLELSEKKALINQPLSESAQVVTNSKSAAEEAINKALSHALRILERDRGNHTEAGSDRYSQTESIPRRTNSSLTPGNVDF